MDLFLRKCQRVKRLLSDRIDGKLPIRLEKKVARHLLKCHKCRFEAAFYSHIKSTVSTMENKRPPDYLWDRISLAVDEHAWGENEDKKQNYLFSFLQPLKNSVNLSFIAVMIIMALCLMPSTFSDTGGAADRISVQASDQKPDAAYLSLYMMSHSEKFPDEVQDYYVNQLHAINHRIDMIKEALQRFPKNRHMRYQLTNIYGKKIKLYRQLGLLSHLDAIDKNELSFNLDYSKDDYYEQ